MEQNRLQSPFTDIHTEGIGRSLQELTLNAAEIEPVRDTLDDPAGGRSFTLIGAQTVGYTDSEKHSEEYLKIKIDNAKRIFVQTKAYGFVRGSLDDANHVTIVGTPGAGKTTLSLVLLNEYKQKGYECHFVDRLDQFMFKRQINPKKPTILVLDDVFGQTGVMDVVRNQDVFDSIESYWEHQQTREKPKRRESRQADPHEEITDDCENEMSLKVIFTSRTNILNKIYNTTGKYKYTLFRKSTVVDLTKDVPLDTSEKEKMLVHHLKQKNVELKKEDILAIANRASSNLGFPFMCKLFTTVTHFQTSPKDFFLKPIAYLVNTMEKMMESGDTQDLRGALLLMVLREGRLKVANISNIELRKKSGYDVCLQCVKEYVAFSDCTSFAKTIAKAARNLIDTYFIEVNGEITFSHPAVYDAVSFIIGRNYPDFVLSKCSMRFIHEKVKVPSPDERKPPMADEYEFIINLTPDFNDVLVARLAQELTVFNFPLVLSHQALGVSSVLDGLFENLLQENTIYDILHNQDHQYGRHFLFWTSFAISKAVTKKSFDVTTFSLKEVAEGLLGCCLSGKKETLEEFIRKSPSFLQTIKSMSIKDILDKETDTRDYLHTLSIANDRENKKFSEDLKCSIHGDPNDKLLHIASANGHTEIAKILLDKGGDIDIKGGLGRTPLMYASRGGHCGLVEMILENGADTSLRDDEGATCLHLASRGGHKDVIKVFVDKRMNINEKGEHDRTPLLYASRYGHSDLVEFLLVHGGDTNLTCAGDNSLHLACVAGNLDSVKILVNHGMDISLEGQQKKTPLMYACRRGHLDVVNFLIEKGAKFDLLDINEGTCLHLAANAGNIDLVKRLIDLGLHADAANKRGRTPVSIAIFQGHLELVKFLFNYCFSQCDKVSELFPLYLPCITGDVEMTNLLLSFKVDINRTGPLKRSPLMRACLNGHTDIINILIKAGADTSAVDEHGSRCIHLACQVGSINSVRILLDSGCDINSRGQNNWTPVMYACRYSNLDLFNLLFEREADTSLVDAKNANSIHLLCKGKDDNAEILTKLVNLGVDFEALDSFHKSPLLYASSKGHINCFELLCRKKADLKLTDLKGTNALHFACQGGHVDIVQQLLALEFDINGRGHQGLTPLMQACHSKAGNLELIEVLLEKGADLYAFDDYGANCLNRACQGGNVKIVQKLLDLKLNLTNQGQNKWTPVMCASRFGHRDVIDVLLNYINKDSLTLRDVNGASCLHLACQGGHVDVIARLLDLGLDINGLGQHQRTPAMYACRSGNTDVLKLLSEKGANTEITDKFRANCLHLSCMGNWDNIDTVKKLVEMAFDVNSTDVYGRTAIMYACKHGHSETFEFLLSKGADVTMRDLRGVSCYKFASNGGHQDLVNRLREVMGT